MEQLTSQHKVGHWPTGQKPPKSWFEPDGLIWPCPPMDHALNEGLNSQLELGTRQYWPRKESAW